MADSRELGSPIIEAKEVYVVMQNDYRISRNIRAQWFFRNLNKVLTFKWKACQADCTEEIEVISAVPKCTESFKVDSETNSSCIKIAPDTKVYFLSTQYRLVFCLDLSSSVSTIDVQHDNIYFEEIYSSLEQSLTSLSEPFYVPGSQFFFMPQIFVTVIAHIPNCVITAPQVLVQGWVLTPETTKALLECLREKLKEVYKLVKKVSVSVQDEQFEFMMPHDADGTIINEPIDGKKMIKKFLDLSADISTLKIIRYGILALQLLPENSSAGMVVITDGVISFPNCKSLDSLLMQLRNSTISCSFLQLGSPFHPYSTFGRVPYKELMEFISTATCGAYFCASRDIVSDLHQAKQMNVYHENLLFWKFQSTATSCFLEAYEPSLVKDDYWKIENPHFYSVAYQSRVRKKHTEGTLKVSQENLLSCRLREGYFVKSVLFDEAKNSTEIRLILPWMLSTNIEYIITSTPGSRKGTLDIPSCHFEVIVDGCYEFLHDVTCSKKKPIKSLYRKTVIAQFWNYIKNLSNTDQILMQLHSFAHNPVYYTIPESIRNGVPLFYFPTVSSMPTPSSKNVASAQFTTFWKLLCMLDINVWQKWMHAHRIGIILQHDVPLPKNLYLANSSGRYEHVQCRQATTALNSLLSEHSSFVLVENHSYIKLLFDEPDKPPYSFYVIRVTSKAPCVVIRLAFLGGLPGLQRCEIVNDLRQKLLSLKRATSKESQKAKSPSYPPESCCCFLLKKPVEKILLRYEKLPSNFLISVPDSQFSSRDASKNSDTYLYVDALITLSKYLSHQRWIWTLQYESNTSLALPSASKILYTLTNIRLEEGFRFSHSRSGIIYMLQEFPVQLQHGELSKLPPSADTSCCVVQYILFPPHTNTTLRDSTSDDDDVELVEADGELQLITESWVEPQLGQTVTSPKLEYLNGLKFSEISAALHKRDFEAVTVLTSFEHLHTMSEKCQKEMNDGLPLQFAGAYISQVLNAAGNGTNTIPVRTFQDNISLIPYCFKLLSLLPKCPQTEIIVSALHVGANANGAEGLTVNDILFTFFLENIRSLHNYEILLTPEDSFIFPFLVHHRTRNDEENPVPFPHPEVNLSDFPSLSQSYFTEPGKSKGCCSFNYSVLNFSNSSHKPLINEGELKEENVPKWRCFVKGCSPNQIILTIISASFKDLKSLYPHDAADFPGNESELMELNADVEAENSIIEADKVAEDIDTKDKDVDDKAAVDDKAEVSCSTTAEAQILNGTDDSSHQNEEEQNYSPDLLFIPLYVYNAVSTSIISKLVSFKDCENEEDSCIKYTFSYEKYTDEQSTLLSEKTVASLKLDDGTDKIKLKQDSYYFNLKDHCAHIEKSYSKAFVYSVYRSLLMGNPVHKFDAIAAIDEICEENLIEVDITEFVSMICGHVKDFTTKHSVRQMHHAKEKKNSDQTDDGDCDNDNNKEIEKCLFPLSLLQKHQPCEHLQQKHLDVKMKFMDIIKNFFKAVPSRPDYFYFCNVEEELEDALEDNNDIDDDDSKNESVVEFDMGAGETVEKGSNFPEDEISAKSLCMNSSLSSFDKDTEPDSSSDRNLFPPLFVHLSCSVRKNKKEIKSCPLASLPTCLTDLLPCLEPDCEELDLDDLRITLDITCLTIPSEIEKPEFKNQRVYSTSFSSTSPVPEAELYQKQELAENVDNSDSSDVQSDTIKGGTLQHLSAFQRESVQRCIDKVKWLLQDEKASVALSSFPITSEILNMVIDHVVLSENKPCCIIKEIPLMFVYGTDCLEKFIQAFKRMSPIGYHLNSIDDIHYLSLDAESAKKLNSHFGSLEPPLGIASKFLIVKSNPHADDHTELKEIAQEIKASSSFAFQQHSHSFDDLYTFKMSTKSPESQFKFILDKSSRKFTTDNDSDTEDAGEECRPKFHRKTSKKNDAFPQASQRTHSTPAPDRRERKRSHSERPRTAPPDFSLLESESQLDSCASNLSEAKKRKYSVSESIGPWVSEAAYPYGSSPETSAEPKGMQLTSTVAPTSRFKPLDSVESPVVFSEPECGSLPFSNTEDGYDGDSSDTGSDLDWLSAVDTRRPVLPKFWIIMKVFDKKVVVYFHMRDRNEDDEELVQCKTILNEIISIVSNICKEVNQVLLLLALYDTRKCSRLLVAEDNDDMWKNQDLDQSQSVLDEAETAMEVQEKYLEATLKLEPGTFSCPVVWRTHFRLHHRLTGYITAHSGRSHGMQALRSVLNRFSVLNRENMFVYQENSGSVFYLRLFEEHCDENHYVGTSKPDDTLSLGSCCSSLQSIPPKKMPDFDLEMEFRPRVNSGASDSYRQDTLSTTSGSRKVQKCVVLHVHGIGEVGTAITKELTQLLQNKLNESILDIIIGMLSRNPHSMLTPEDVQFIQNPCSPPTHEVHFTLPVKLLGYAHSIHIYLRQNLLHFLYNPKYTDNKPENHFKGYFPDPMEWNQVEDNDIFLYYSKPAIGQPGGKGISCIVLSLVTGQGAPYQNYANLLPNPNAYQDGLSESEYEDLTTTSMYVMKNEKSPGPVALIRFHIWSIGWDSFEILKQKLSSAVRQALWDLLMEYKALTSPISDATFLEDSSCYSEPSTPKKVRRAGAEVDPNLHLKDFPASANLQAAKEISSSVPDIAAKVQSPPTLAKEIASFKFGSRPQSAKPEFISEVSKSAQTQSSPSSSIDKQNLNSMYHTLLVPFLQFGESLACPSLHKTMYELPSRQSVYLVSQDIQNIFKSVPRDVPSRDTPNMYLETYNTETSEVEYVPLAYYQNIHDSEIDDPKPGTVRNFIIIGRNETQWKAYMGMLDFLKFHENSLDSMKALQKFYTHICVPKAVEPSVDSVPSSPTLQARSTPVSVGSPQSKSSVICTTDWSGKSASAVHFVPRQRLFFILIQDKKITAYLYNFHQDLIMKLSEKFSDYIVWHHRRNCLLKNIVLQKLGIFHGLPSFRPEITAIKDTKPSTAKGSREESLAVTSAVVVEQLIHNKIPTKDSHSVTSSARSSIGRIAYKLRSLKNLKPHKPFHLSPSAKFKDALEAHGTQYLSAIASRRRDLQVLYNMWDSRGSSIDHPSDRVFMELKRSARLSHYCLTPILFSTSWRWKVAPIRDHAIDLSEPILPAAEKTEVVSSRSRHSSGSSAKNAESSASSGNNSLRSRRPSGNVYPAATQSSPKLRAKTPSEETWHSTVCRHYLQEYVQFLHTLGFVSLQTSDTTSVQRRRSAGGQEDKISRSDSFSKRHGRGPPVFYLIKCLLGGLLVFEVGLSEPYAYAHLYSIEGSRFKGFSNRPLNSQFIAAFLDEQDKVKLHMHLHSFTYDYHLRTIHSYISGRQLIFRNGYHLTSFLDDFIKYYQKAPTGAHNILHAGTLTINDTSMSPSQLYNYIISHNLLYGMTVLRMNPVILESSSSIDTEFALIELSAPKAPYKEYGDAFQLGNFDFGLLINQNTSENLPESKDLVLNFYIILTSQRDLFPKLLNFGTSFGSFQPIRYGSSRLSKDYASRSISMVAMTEKDKFESSGEETISSAESSRTKKFTVIRGMCDEDVTYLGYYSSQESSIQKVLRKQAEVSKNHLIGVFNRALIHCRRDSLWSSLLPRSWKEENASKEQSGLSPMSLADFSELLNLVSVIPLSDIDVALTPFMNMNIAWYVNLAPVLKAKYVETHREFKSPDGSSMHVVVTNIQCPDSFLLLTVDIQVNKAELNVVFREDPKDMEHVGDEPSIKTLALHSLIEGFVNACCYHLWSSMLSS